MTFQELAALKHRAAQGYTTVVIEFSGEGDMGGIDAQYALDAAGRRHELFPVLEAAFSGSELCYNMLHLLQELEPTGYENEAGGHGTVTVDLASLRVTERLVLNDEDDEPGHPGWGETTTTYNVAEGNGATHL